MPSNMTAGQARTLLARIKDRSGASRLRPDVSREVVLALLENAVRWQDADETIHPLIARNVRAEAGANVSISMGTEPRRSAPSDEGIEGHREMAVAAIASVEAIPGSGIPGTARLLQMEDGVELEITLREAKRELQRLAKTDSHGEQAVAALVELGRFWAVL